MSFLTDDQIEGEALKLRLRFGISATDTISWSAICGKLDRAFKGLRLIVVDDEEMTRAAAEADRDENKIRIRQTVYNRLRSDCSWALEILIHELCHFQLDHQGVNYRMIGVNHSRHSRGDEPQAHLLAKAVLAPRVVVEGASVLELIENYNLQKTSAEKRLEIVERMTRRQRGNERPLPSGVIDFLQQARARGHKVKSLD